MPATKLAPAKCLGRRDWYSGEYTCDHEYASDVLCDHCRFGPDKDGLDPRYLNGKRSHKAKHEHIPQR